MIEMEKLKSVFITLFGILFFASFIQLSIFQDYTSKKNFRFEKIQKDILEEKFKDLRDGSTPVSLSRIREALYPLGIINYEIAEFINNDCISNDKACSMGEYIREKNPEAGLIVREYNSDIFYVLNVNEHIIVTRIPKASFISNSTWLDTAFYQVTPFVVLILLFLFTFIALDKLVLVKLMESIKQNERRNQSLLFRQILHDIRSPLSTLDTASELVEDEDLKELIAESSKRILLIANGYLSDSNTVNQENSCNVREVFIKLFEAKRSEYKNVNVGFNLTSVKNFPLLQISQINFYRVASNLLNNAIESAKNFAVNIEVTLNITHENFEISIEDNGVGIPEDKLALVTSGLYSSREDGNGLGLSGAASWAQSINGRLEVSSIKGIGTKILILISRSLEAK